MQIKNVIVHILHKEQATKNNPSPKTIVEKSKNLFDKTHKTVIGFSEKLASSYFDKKTRFYTSFKKLESMPRFQQNLDELLGNKVGFLKFSKIIVDDLKEEMDSEIMSTGGYLIVLDYESSNGYKYLFIALLNNKIEYAIDNTLKLNEFLSLNIDKMAMASVINISKYHLGDYDYITFLKGVRDIPDYFIKFIGADKDKKRDLRTQTRSWIDAINNYLKNESTENKDILIIIQDLIDRVKILKKEEKFLTADAIANIIEPTNPEKFIEYIYDEKNDYNLNPEMETMDTTVLRNHGIIKYENRQKDFLLKFSKKSIGDIISIDHSKKVITINDKDIVAGIEKEVENQKNIK